MKVSEIWNLSIAFEWHCLSKKPDLLKSGIWIPTVFRGFVYLAVRYSQIYYFPTVIQNIIFFFRRRQWSQSGLRTL